MEAVNVHEQIRGFIAEAVGESDPSRIDESVDLFAEGWLDSLVLMRLVGYIEKAFGIAVSGSSIVPANFATIGAIGAFVARKRSGR
jgi:acyl carrier protein